MKYVFLAGLATLALTGCSEGHKEVALQECGAPQPDAIGLNPDGSVAAINRSDSEDARRKIGLIGTTAQTAEVVRQLSWQLCNARSNRWIDDDYYRRELTAMREAVFNATSASSRSLPAKDSSAQETSSTAACLAAAGDDDAKKASCASE